MLEIIRKYKDKSRLFIKEKFTEDGAGWLFLQQLIIAPMSLITTVLLARLLSISNYGYYKYILSVYAIIALFSIDGIRTITIMNIQRGDNFFF
jgi:O-antigen/teichoic acid export membrane protein